MKYNNKRLLIYRIVITAIFTALCYVGTFVSIPAGISKVHLGNLVCIIAGLLCGPLIGGISGSVGMALNDLTLGYGPDTIFRTFMVKFIMGFVTGLLFRAFVRKKKNVNFIYGFIIALFGIVFVTFLTLYILKGTSFEIGTRTFKNSLFLVITLGIITLFFAMLLIFSNKIKKLQQYVLISTSLGLVINIAAEFILKIPLKMLFAEMTFDAAFIYATISLPSALLTAILTIVFVTFIYCPIYFATERINKLNDLYEDIQAITSKKTNEEN